MKIGIVVYSQTGHTLSVASKLAEKLASLGHKTSLKRLESEDFKIDEFETVIFCSPVHGGEPAQQMKDYINRIPSLEGKKAACMVTGVFPAGMGRNKALESMKRLCESKGATVCGVASAGWWSFRRSVQIREAVESIVSCF
jgi:flavodoxin